MSKEYLGDSVYVEFDDGALVLTTENGYPEDPANRIVIEESVYVNLVAYVEHLKAKRELAKEPGP